MTISNYICNGKGLKNPIRLKSSFHRQLNVEVATNLEWSKLRSGCLEIFLSTGKNSPKQMAITK